MNEFQERLQELLLEKNINRVQLSHILDVAPSTINGYFNYNHFPKIEIAIKMTKYFDCSLDYLFGLSDKRKNSDKNNNSFFYNFDKLIKDNKLSISPVMKKLKMSEYNYYRWKAGLFPKTINLIDIAKYFDVSIDYLVGKI